MRVEPGKRYLTWSGAVTGEMTFSRTCANSGDVFVSTIPFSSQNRLYEWNESGDFLIDSEPVTFCLLDLMRAHVGFKRGLKYHE